MLLSAWGALLQIRAGQYVFSEGVAGVLVALGWKADGRAGNVKKVEAVRSLPWDSNLLLTNGAMGKETGAEGHMHVCALIAWPSSRVISFSSPDRT
jgi:hypothetical protein